MKIKRIIIPLLLIILLASTTAFGSNVPLGPYYDDTYFDLSGSALILKIVPHEKGGLEADVSGYDGLIKITGGATSNLTIGIADNNIVEIDDADATVDDYCKLTANGVVGRSYSEVKTDLTLNYVENTKVKLDATQAPTVNNDTSEGYTAGSFWVDVTNDKAYICLDNTDGAAVWTETTQAGGGYTNLTSFVEQTAWRVFYSNTDGDVVELPLGADGTYFKSNGAAAAPTFSVPAGGGDVAKVGTPANSQIGVWTGDGTIEGAASLTYDGSNLQLTGDIGSTGTRITKGWFANLETTGDLTVNGTALASTYQTILTNEAGLYGALSDVNDFVQAAEANSIDSVMYVDGSIDHEHLAPDVISGLADVTSADADYILIWDATDSALKKCDMGEVRGTGGFTTFSQFDEETAWRVYYSDGSGDITELALGADGTYFKSNGAAAAPTFATPGGAGETNTASNVGENVEIYKQKDGVDLEFRTLKAVSDKILITTTPAGGEIDIGMSAENRGATLADGDTAVNKGNVANAAGKITNIEIWANQSLVGCKVATFFVVAGNNLSARDSQLIGSVTAGSKQTFPVDLDVEIGDYIGLYYSGGKIDAISTGGDGMWQEAGDQTSCVNKSFNSFDGYIFSLYGTGTTSVLDYIRFDIEESEIRLDDLKATEDNTNLNASTSAHGLMPKLPFSGDLLSTTTVAFNADADTTLYTVPTGKRCVLTHAIVVTAGDTGATTTVSIGANGAETDFVPANTLSNLDAQYDSVILMPIPNTTPLKIKSYAAATVIEAQVASQSGVAGNTIYLFGILY